MNATCAESLKQWLPLTDAHIVLAQEVKTSGTGTAALSKWAAKAGWKALIADASHNPETRRRRAGVAIFVRDWIGLGWPRAEPVLYSNRVIISLVDVPGLQPFDAAAAYLFDGEGASERTLDVLRFVGENWQS